MSLPPWLQLQYFQAPQVWNNQSIAGITTLFPGDPNCVLLVFSQGAGAGVGSNLIAPAGLLGANSGIALANTGQPFVVDIASFGPLTTMEWQVDAPSGGYVYCLSYSVKSWPQSTSLLEAAKALAEIVSILGGTASTGG